MHQGAGGGGDQPGRGAHPDRPPVPGGTPAGASETVSWAWPWSNTAVRHRRCRTSMASTPLRVIFTTTVTSPSRCPPAADHDQAAGQLRRTRPPAWARERGDMRAESLTVRLTGRPTAGRGSSGRAWLHDGGAAGIFRLPMARSPDCTFPSASPAPKERRADAIRRRARSRGGDRRETAPGRCGRARRPSAPRVDRKFAQWHAFYDGKPVEPVLCARRCTVMGMRTGARRRFRAPVASDIHSRAHFCHPVGVLAEPAGAAA